MKRINQKKVIDELCAQIGNDSSQPDHSEYIKKRLDNQLKWYRSHANSNRRWFYALTIIAFALPSIVAIINFATVGEIRFEFSNDWWEDFKNFKPLITAVLSAVTAFITFLIGLYRYNEHWTNYRHSLERILSVADLYCAKADPYDKPDRTPKFIQKVEEIIGDEISQWTDDQSQISPSPTRPKGGNPAAPA